MGEELREQGGLGLLLALGIVMLYVAFRFQFKFSVGAVVALIHDVLIVLGVFALFGLDFDLTVLAAVLAVIGYSLNDSIVVADRIRENFRIIRTDDPLKGDEHLDQSDAQSNACDVCNHIVGVAGASVPRRRNDSQLRACADHWRGSGNLLIDLCGDQYAPRAQYFT